jgi:hypothetical protein
VIAREVLVYRDGVIDMVLRGRNSKSLHGIITLGQMRKTRSTAASTILLLERRMCSSGFGEWHLGTMSKLPHENFCLTIFKSLGGRLRH